MRGCFIFTFFLFLAINANGATPEQELREIANSIRIAERQSTNIQEKLELLNLEKESLIETISKYQYQIAKNQHGLYVLEKSPSRLLFLLNDSSYQNYYFQNRKLDTLKQVLSAQLSSIAMHFIDLEQKQTDIKNYLVNRENLSNTIQSYLSKISSINKTKQIDENLLRDIEQLKMQNKTLDGFLYELIDMPTQSYFSIGEIDFALPVSGIITPLNNNIIEIKTARNALVTAPANGRIIYADEFKNLGKIIIIDHGQNYISILKNYSEILVEVGSEITKGEPLGLINGDEWNKFRNNPMLYYELRYNNNSINPMTKISGY